MHAACMQNRDSSLLCFFRVLPSSFLLRPPLVPSLVLKLSSKLPFLRSTLSKPRMSVSPVYLFQHRVDPLLLYERNGIDTRFFTGEIFESNVSPECQQWGPSLQGNCKYQLMIHRNARHSATHYLSTTRMSWVATGVLQNRLLTQWVPLKIFLLHPLQVLHLWHCVYLYLFFQTLLTNAQRATDGGPLNPTAAEFFKTNDEAAIKKKQEAYRTANAGSIATAASAFKSATPFPAFVASSSWERCYPCELYPMVTTKMCRSILIIKHFISDHFRSFRPTNIRIVIEKRTLTKFNYWIHHWKSLIYSFISVTYQCAGVLHTVHVVVLYPGDKDDSYYESLTIIRIG